MNILEIKNLDLSIDCNGTLFPLLKNINFELNNGQMLSIVGESGCGKTMTALSILKLLPTNTKIQNGQIIFQNQNILNFNEKQMQHIRGAKIALIPQDPMTSLNPVYTIGNQMIEVIKLHRNVSDSFAKDIAIKSLCQVNISNPEKRLKCYPHQLSGGMKQRIIIAMALSTRSNIIIADEPTTALDVTVQKQIMDLLSIIKNKFHTSIILISHDLALVSQYCDKICVMYHGEIVESIQNFSTSSSCLQNCAKHPYTKALIQTLPQLNYSNFKLSTIKGYPPSIYEKFQGCSFSTRCSLQQNICLLHHPNLTNLNTKHSIRCWLYQQH